MWMRTGKVGPTEVAQGLQQDETDTYLSTTQNVLEATFLTVFGEVVIIRDSEPEGKQLGTLYEQIRNEPSLQKCQDTVKAPMGTSIDYVWIVPQSDKLLLISQHPPKPLKEALSRPAILHGHGHMAQHSCCKRND